jgi:hypothetical protein
MQQWSLCRERHWTARWMMVRPAGLHWLFRAGVSTVGHGVAWGCRATLLLGVTNLLYLAPSHWISPFAWPRLRIVLCSTACIQGRDCSNFKTLSSLHIIFKYWIAEGGCVVGYRAVTLLMEAVNSSETSLSIYQTARRYVAEYWYFYRR